jgi:hypothetical protein
VSIIKQFSLIRIALILGVGLGMNGCVVVSAVSAAVSVGSAAVSVGATAVKVGAKTVGVAADVLIPDSEPKKD